MANGFLTASALNKNSSTQTLTRLRRLELHLNNVHHSALRMLMKCQELEQLLVSGCDFPSSSLQYLRFCSDLKDVRLRDTDQLERSDVLCVSLWCCPFLTVRVQ